MAKRKVGTDSNASLIGAGTHAPARQLLGLPVYVDRHVTADTLVVLDRTAILSAYGNVQLATSADYAFNRDSIALRVTFRFGQVVADADRVVARCAIHPLSGRPSRRARAARVFSTLPAPDSGSAFAELDAARALVAGDQRAAVRDHGLGRERRRPGLRHDDGVHALAPLGRRDADHRALRATAGHAARSRSRPRPNRRSRRR